MGKVKDAFFTDTALEQEAEAMYSDPEYNEWLDELERESEHIRSTEETVPQGEDSLEGGGDQ